MRRVNFDSVLRHATPLLRVALLVAVGDLLTKQTAIWLLADGETVYSSWLRFTLVHNDAAPLGLSFGIWTFHINWMIATGAILLMLVASRDLARIDPEAPVALGLIVGAALGNLSSLLMHDAGVVDFVAVGVGGGVEVVLNAADIAAYVGLALLGRTAWRVVSLARSPARAVISERLRGRDVALRLMGDREIVRSVAVAADRAIEQRDDLWTPKRKQDDRPNPVMVVPIFDERPRSMGAVQEEAPPKPPARVIDLQTWRSSNEGEQPEA